MSDERERENERLKRKTVNKREGEGVWFTGLTHTAVVSVIQLFI
jgi:hypothetical protein